MLPSHVFVALYFFAMIKNKQFGLKCDCYNLLHWQIQQIQQTFICRPDSRRSYGGHVPLYDHTQCPVMSITISL